MLKSKAELDFISSKLSEPLPIMALNYDGLNAPAAAVISNSDETAASNFIRVSANAVDASQLEYETWRYKDAVVFGSTPCIVCGTGINVHSPYDSTQKICSDCKKAVLYIRNKFKEEIENL
jgi:hypothetical protein